MDSNNQYPTMWTTGFVGGVKVSFTFPIRNEMDAFSQAKTIVDKLLADGFTTTEPGLIAGEESEMIGKVSRRSKKNNDGSISPVIDLYGTNAALKFRIISIYLDTPEAVTAFETACGIKLTSLPLNPTKAAVERDDENFVVELQRPAKAILKNNPDYREDSEDKKPKRLFVRWETATPTPQPPPTVPAQAAVGTPTPSERVAGDEQRNSRLHNEELVITRVEKTGTISGNKDPKKNGDKYDGWGKIEDGGTFDVRVWIFPENIPDIKAGGYDFHVGNNLHIPVILDTSDRAMTRIGSVIPKETPNAAKTIVSGFQTNLTKTGKPYLIFSCGDSYAYSYTREPFRLAGYNVDGWDTVGIHEMPTPAELVCEWDKQQKNLVVKSAIMVDQFADKVAS